MIFFVRTGEFFLWNMVWNEFPHSDFWKKTESLYLSGFSLGEPFEAYAATPEKYYHSFVLLWALGSQKVNKVRTDLWGCWNHYLFSQCIDTVNSMSIAALNIFASWSKTRCLCKEQGNSLTRNNEVLISAKNKVTNPTKLSNLGIFYLNKYLSLENHIKRMHYEKLLLP